MCLACALLGLRENETKVVLEAELFSVFVLFGLVDRVALVWFVGGQSTNNRQEVQNANGDVCCDVFSGGQACAHKILFPNFRLEETHYRLVLANS